ncbi:hypothetical protein PCG10_005770 [Penicillium crustosum]|uniref:Uncharacterized protein n=1 Tax=Penicillium crustosum TaxID=36656 RepID=A0A9P5L4Q4_PENCR|nr:hypothetical protein PCG10_005770 [Penicillium crustosum]
MAPGKTKVLFTGATGYIGGSVLEALLTSQIEVLRDEIVISAPVRKQDQAQILESKGVKSFVFNGLDDTAQMENLSREHDVVIHTASTMHTEAIEAMITGLAGRREATGKHRIFSDKSDNIYQYLKDRQEIEDLPVRRSDVAIVEIGRRLAVPTFILMSPLIYGVGTGLFNKLSIQIPAMARGAIQAQRAEVVGDGSQRWGNIHIADLGDLYELLLSKIPLGDNISSGENGIYFTVADEHMWMDIAKGIASVGSATGTLKSGVESVSLQEAADRWMNGNTIFTETVFASNAWARSDLARELGWKPKFDASHLQSAIEADMKAILG